MRIALGALAALLAGVPAASAATLRVDGACYVLAGRNAPPLTFSGHGFHAGDEVLVATPDGTIDTTARADRAGAIRGTTLAPDPVIDQPVVEHVALTAVDELPDGGQITASTRINVTTLGWHHGSTAAAPGLGAFRETTTWQFSGFVPGKLIFGHYLFGGREVARATFGRARPPCGTLSTRARLFPGTARHPSYTVQYDDRRAYSRRSRPRIVGDISLLTF